MPDLNSGFASMAAPAKALQVAQNERQFGMRLDRQDVIHLKAASFRALDTGPAITLKGCHAQSLPPGRPADPRGMVRIVAALAVQAHAMRPPRCLGRARRRAPSATASTVAAAASIRPRERDLASL